MKKKNRILVLICILLLILIITIMILNSKKEEKGQVVSENTDNTTYFENSSIEKLAAMTEKERITFYFSKYIESIITKDYETAYGMLYDEFKNTYFNTLEEFENYIIEKYPEVTTVDYLGFQREGVYYILSTEIKDGFGEKSFKQKFVIREYNFDDFVLSFQVYETEKQEDA